MSALDLGALADLDAEALRVLADALAPYQSGRPDTGGWMSPRTAVAYLDLGSLDALDRLVREGLPCVQPSGPGGRRSFRRDRLDAWMEGHR